MKTHYINWSAILFLVLILFTSCKTLKGDKSDAAEDYFKIEIVQNNKVIPISDNSVVLKKEPFKFKVTLIKTTDVYVSASWDKYYYDYPDSNNIFECKDTKQFNGCRFVAIKTGNQDAFNINKDLAIGDSSYQWVWFYDETMDWHRFDSTVIVKNGVTHAEMTVENIYDCDGRDAYLETTEYEYTIENIEKEIYMVFATNYYERGMAHPKELQRKKFKLQFDE